MVCFYCKRWQREYIWKELVYMPGVHPFTLVARGFRNGWVDSNFYIDTRGVVSVSICRECEQRRAQFYAQGPPLPPADRSSVLPPGPPPPPPVTAVSQPSPAGRRPSPFAAPHAADP